MYALRAGGDFDVIYVEEDAELVIDGIRITREEGTLGRGIKNYGILVLLEGVIDVHDTPRVTARETFGAGVWNGGLFTMYGGLIANNVSACCAGGVQNNNSFVMRGGGNQEQ